MNKMMNYCNQEFEFNDCPACSYAKHEFSLPCGMAYENSNYTLSQDWKLPIPGFLVVSPKRHIEKFGELAEGVLKPKNYRNLLIKQMLPRWCMDLIRKIKH